jgi:hypothetical protein
VRLWPIFFLLALPLSGSIKSKDILDLFEETALTWPRGSTSLSSREQKLCKKRTNPINVSLLGNWSSKYKSEVSKAMNDLKEIINLEIKFSEEAEIDFLKIYDDWQILTEQTEINDRFHPSFYWAWYIYYSDQNPFSISEGYGFINCKEADANFVYATSLRILIGSLGFTNRTESWKFRDSFFYSFNDYQTKDVRNLKLSDLDKAVIRLLYEDSIKPGMNIREIKRICSQNGLLEKVTTP